MNEQYIVVYAKYNKQLEKSEKELLKNRKYVSRIAMIGFNNAKKLLQPPKFKSKILELRIIECSKISEGFSNLREVGFPTDKTGNAWVFQIEGRIAIVKSKLVR